MEVVVDSIRKLEIGEIQGYGNLAIAPLIGANSSLDYLVMSEAINQGLKIGEVSRGGNVETIYVQNETGKNVLAIAGVYIRGCKQSIYKKCLFCK
jgi:hypothetical protein